MKKEFYFKKNIILICFFLNSCAEIDQNSKQYNYNDLAALTIASVVLYGSYRAAEVAKKDSNTISEKYRPLSCYDLYQNFQGCCSHHNGVAGCSGYYVICNDATISKSCTCTVDRCLVL